MVFLKITLQEVQGFPQSISHYGGYDTNSAIEIQSDGFKVLATFWLSTGEIFNFYQDLKKANALLTGLVRFVSSEENLEFNVVYKDNGHISIQGLFSNQNWHNNF